MFDKVIRMKREVERDDGRIQSKVDCRRSKKNGDQVPMKEQTIKAATIF